MYQVPTSLLESAKSKNLTLFIGAGLSFGIGLPTWKGLVVNIVKSLRDKEPLSEALLQALESGAMEPIEVLEKVKHLKTFAIEILEKEIRKHDDKIPSKVYSKLSPISSKIITTNYDQLLEKAYPHFVKITHSNAYRVAKMSNYDKYIFKIHGDIEEPDKCILFREQYDELYTKEQTSSSFELAKILSDHSFLFIGFSLTDPYFNNIVNFIRTLYSGFTPEHFIITTDKNKVWPDRITPIFIENYDCLEDLLSEIESGSQSLEIASNKLAEDVESDTSALDKGMKIFNQHLQEIGYDLKRDDLEKLLIWKIKMEELMFKDFEKAIDNLSVRKESLYSSVLFDLIFATERIPSSIISQIHSIRVDSENHKWYDRSLIVSALTLSLMNFKFDVTKANILLDFVSQFEDKVWQKALTGLLIAIVSQPNRSWMRDQNFINRLKSLRTNEDIQVGIEIIDFILRNELYKANVLIPNIFEMEIFQKAINYFVPFYNDNKVYTYSIYNAPNYVNIERFKEIIDNVPFLDFVKYSICLNIDEWFKDEKEKSRKNISPQLLNSVFDLSAKYHPYHLIISELFFYFQNFKDSTKKRAFDKSLQVAHTDLRTIILNKEAQLLLEGNSFFTKGEYKHAILKFEALLQLKSNHEEALWQTGACYFNISDHKEALKYFLKIKTDDYPRNDDPLFAKLYWRIADCYNRLKDYKKSLFYLHEILNTKFTPTFNLFWSLADNYDELEDGENCKYFCNKAIDLAISPDDKFKIASLLKKNGELEKSSFILDEIILVDENHADAVYLKGDIHLDKFEWVESLKFLNKYLEIKKTEDYNLTLARLYILSKMDFGKGIEILDEILLNAKDDSELEALAYGNLGHVSILQGDITKAKNNYQLCSSILGKQEFSKRMHKDSHFFEYYQLNIIYNQIKEEIMMTVTPADIDSK
jgi:tetratricopeptide (TPR) repeat protein/NAD-dependent SIR2 family protein deacetylase